MIKPTVGRVVNFYPSIYNNGGHPEIVCHEGGQPFAATVAYVWNDRLVNLAFVDHNGIPFNATSVQLLQDDDAAPETGFYAEWMGYQKGQAAKTEKAEATLKAVVVPGVGVASAAAVKLSDVTVGLASTEAECAAADRVAGDGFSFSAAVVAIKDGYRVARRGWNGKGMWLALQTPDARSKMSLPYIYMRTVDAKLVPWLASQTDILADDWTFAPPEAA